MTDINGHRHPNTVPVGQLHAEIWAKHKAHAARVPNPPFLELVNKTTQPFISTVQDCAAPRASFFDHKLLLVGEALTLYRPHTRANFNQSSLDCLLLRKALQGEISFTRWEQEVLQTAQLPRLLAVATGEYFQSGVLSLRFLLGVVRFCFALTLSRLARLWRLFSS